MIHGFHIRRRGRYRECLTVFAVFTGGERGKYLILNLNSVNHRLSTVLSRYRKIAGGAVISTGNGPDRPESGIRPEDTEIITGVAVIIGGNAAVGWASKIYPAHFPYRP